MEERLWEYIDGLSSEEDKASIRQLLQTKAEWQLKYDELLSIHELIHKSELEVPSMRFAQNVMEEIARHQIAPATKTYIDKRIVYGLGGFFLVMITGLLVYFLAQLKWTSTTSTNTSFDFSKVQWGNILNSSYANIFMIINVVLGLMLLDRYLNRRKQEVKESNHQN